MSGLYEARAELPRGQILAGNALARLQSLPTSSIDTVVTSPPYFRLRNYGHEQQTGSEATVDEWVTDLRQVMRQLSRVLVPTGTVWLNLGDTYSTHLSQGAPRKSLVAAPERLLLALIRDGWIVRNKVVWAKSNPTPSSVRDRLTCTYEVAYLLAKSPSYFFDLDAIRQPLQTSARPRKRPTPETTAQKPSWLGTNADAGHGLDAMKQRGMVGHPLGKNPGDVWTLSTSRYRGTHFATFPEHLIAPMLRATCPERRCTACLAAWTRPVKRLGALATQLALRPSCECAPTEAAAHTLSEPGVVLDPYMGAGTTALAALHQNKDWVGIELNPAFIDLAMNRLRDAEHETTTNPKGGVYA